MSGDIGAHKLLPACIFPSPSTILLIHPRLIAEWNMLIGCDILASNGITPRHIIHRIITSGEKWYLPRNYIYICIYMHRQRISKVYLRSAYFPAKCLVSWPTPVIFSTNLRELSQFLINQEGICICNITVDTLLRLPWYSHTVLNLMTHFER